MKLHKCRSLAPKEIRSFGALLEQDLAFLYPWCFHEVAFWARHSPINTHLGIVCRRMSSHGMTSIFPWSWWHTPVTLGMRAARRILKRCHIGIFDSLRKTSILLTIVVCMTASSPRKMSSANKYGVRSTLYIVRTGKSIALGRAKYVPPPPATRSWRKWAKPMCTLSLASVLCLFLILPAR